MLHRQRVAAAVLCVLFVLGLNRAAAAQDGIYFVAVETIILPLTEETMPFWHDGYLYLSGDVFTGNARDALGISRAKIGDAILLYRGEQSLLFRKDYPYAQDSQENTYAPGMVWRGENGYVPASVVARYFNLLYSSTDVEHGKLVWLRSTSFTMSERSFAKAATFQLNTAYQEYVRSMEPEPLPEPEPVPVEEPEPPDEPPAPTEIVPETVSPEPPEASAPPAVTPSAPEEKPAAPSVPKPATPSTANPAAPKAATSNPAAPSVPKPATPNPVTPSVPNSVTPPTSNPVTPPSVSDPEPVGPSVTAEPAPPENDVGGQQIYLCLRGNSMTASLLDALDRHKIHAAVFCDETFLTEQGDLLRRMTATGHRIGLYVRSGNALSVLERLETCNALLRRTTMEKTRLAYVDGGGEELLRAVRDAGFVCLRPTLSQTETPLRTSRQAADLLHTVSEYSGTLSLWIGGTVNRSGLNAFLADALEIGDAFLPWNETADF